MIIVCNVEGCPYRSINSFCRNRVTAITQRGQCGHIFDKFGNQKLHWREPIDEEYMAGYKKPQPPPQQIENKGETTT